MVLDEASESSYTGDGRVLSRGARSGHLTQVRGISLRNESWACQANVLSRQRG